MTIKTEIKIEVINEKSPYLSTVIALGDAHKATLGFFSEGAFREQAARGKIIVAVDVGETCVGYLMYRTSYDRITIVHLCAAPEYRGKGIGKKLIKYLKQITQKRYSGIGLYCRRDYGLDEMWSRFGFVAKFEKAAKTPGKLLIYWWFDYNNPNLFSSIPTQKRESKLCVILDFPVFLDLYPEAENNNFESKSLLADWLDPYLELCITDEIFNQINKIRDDMERHKKRLFAEKFTFLPYEEQRFNNIYQSLGDISNKFDRSNLRHLGKTIASDTHTFITRDRRLLERVDEFYDRFQLSIKTPTELILQLDELNRKPQYQPVRLAGTQLKQRKVHSEETSRLNNYFLATAKGETKAEFQQRLWRFLSEPDKFACFVISQGEDRPLALVVYHRYNSNELEIPLLRVSDRDLAFTLSHHLIFLAASISAKERRNFTRITDPYLQEKTIQAIQQDAFVEAKHGWLRANIALADTKLNLAHHLLHVTPRSGGEEYNFCLHLAKNMESEINDIPTMLSMERFLFPAKIIDTNIPTFIIPIKPFWAHNLFDAKLANQTLLGSTKIQLALNREAVYYKSKQGPKQLKPGVSGRILWYVSNDKDGGYTGVSAIRACSRLEEVIIGKPISLYGCFRHLGIYTKQNVLAVARHDVTMDIMAIKFSDTELFDNYIPLKKVREIVNKKLTMQSAFYLKNEEFARIYKMGIN